MSRADGNYTALDIAREKLDGLIGAERQDTKRELFGTLYRGAGGPIFADCADPLYPMVGGTSEVFAQALGRANRNMAPPYIHNPPKKERKMNKPVIRRHPASSKACRRMISPGVDFFPHTVSNEVTEWNRKVDAKNELKRLKNVVLRTGKPEDVAMYNNAVAKFHLAYPLSAPPSVPTGGKTQVQQERLRAATASTGNGGLTG